MNTAIKGNINSTSEMTTMSATILVIEDDFSISESVAYTLRQEGFNTLVAHDGPAGLDKALTMKPDLILLDLMLPVMDGFDVFRALRKHMTVPVIMLTAKAGESDRVAGIELGADDYIVKPFYMRELVARVKLILRRASTVDQKHEDVVVVRDLSIDVARRIVKVGERVIDLTPQEFSLLECLARNAGRVLTRDIILQQAWGESEYIDPRTVDVHMRWLRQKIEESPEMPSRLMTIRGIGYKLAE